MKRHTGLVRTPMPPRTTPIKRTSIRAQTPVEHGDTTGPCSTGPTRGPIKPRKPAVSREEREAKRLVRLRSQGWCELQLPGCWGRAYDFSHRIARGRGGLWLASNGCDACRLCHTAVTNTNGRRPHYEYLGYICRTDADTTAELAWLRGEHWVLLTDDGHILDIPPTAQGDI